MTYGYRLYSGGKICLIGTGFATDGAAHAAAQEVMNEALWYYTKAEIVCAGQVVRVIDNPQQMELFR